MHAISSKVSPISGSSGIQKIEWQSGSMPFHLYSFQSLTGTLYQRFQKCIFACRVGLKILITVDVDQTQCELVLKRIYELYTDYALKNPFHKLEMPIRSELFDMNLARLCKELSTTYP